MWEVRTQFSKSSADCPSGSLEWNAVLVDTAEEAEMWWRTRVVAKTMSHSVCTMFDPEGNLVRVHFK